MYLLKCADVLTPPRGRHNVLASRSRGGTMHIDRRAFLATLGSAAVVESMSSEARADALEHYLIAQLDKAPAAKTSDVRSGTGAPFGGPSPSGLPAPLPAPPPIPAQPTRVESR